MAKQAIERTLEEALRGFPAKAVTRGELALKDGARCCAPPARGCAPPAIEALPARTRPTRMCLGCRERAAQSELIRIFSLHSDSSSHYVDGLRNVEHSLAGKHSGVDGKHSGVDGKHSGDLSTGERSWFILPPLQQDALHKDDRPVSLHGRSAYVHDSPSCFKGACIAQRLQRAFRETVSTERAQSLLAALETVEVHDQVSSENTTNKMVLSKDVVKICRMNTYARGRGGEASAQTEQIKREAKE